MGKSLFQKLVGIGLSKGYASDIANGVRQPGTKMALRIYAELGVKLGPIKNASPQDIRATSRALAAQ